MSACPHPGPCSFSRIFHLWEASSQAVQETGDTPGEHRSDCSRPKTERLQALDPQALDHIFPQSEQW